MSPLQALPPVGNVKNPQELAVAAVCFAGLERVVRAQQCQLVQGTRLQSGGVVRMPGMVFAVQLALIAVINKCTAAVHRCRFVWREQRRISVQMLVDEEQGRYDLISHEWRSRNTVCMLCICLGKMLMSITRQTAVTRAATP